MNIPAGTGHTAPGDAVQRPYIVSGQLNAGTLSTVTASPRHALVIRPVSSSTPVSMTSRQKQQQQQEKEKEVHTKEPPNIKLLPGRSPNLRSKARSIDVGAQRRKLPFPIRSASVNSVPSPAGVDTPSSLTSFRSGRSSASTVGFGTREYASTPCLVQTQELHHQKKRHNKRRATSPGMGVTLNSGFGRTAATRVGSSLSAPSSSSSSISRHLSHLQHQLYSQQQHPGQRYQHDSQGCSLNRRQTNHQHKPAPNASFTLPQHPPSSPAVYPHANLRQSISSLALLNAPLEPDPASTPSSAHSRSNSNHSHSSHNQSSHSSGFEFAKLAQRSDSRTVKKTIAVIAERIRRQEDAIAARSINAQQEQEQIHEAPTTVSDDSNAATRSSRTTVTVESSPLSQQRVQVSPPIRELEAIGHWAQDLFYRIVMIKKNMIPILVAAMRAFTSNEPTLHALCCEILLVLCEGQLKNHRLLESLGGVRLVVAALRNYPESSRVEEAASALLKCINASGHDDSTTVATSNEDTEHVHDNDNDNDIISLESMNLLQSSVEGTNLHPCVVAASTDDERGMDNDRSTSNTVAVEFDEVDSVEYPPVDDIVTISDGAIGPIDGTSEEERIRASEMLTETLDLVHPRY